MADITAIILTRNEEEYIKECILSIKSIVKRIIVIDSFSEDDTVKIAKDLGAEVILHEFVTHAKQYIYAVENSNINTTWIMRIDADERLTDESREELNALCEENNNTNINGIELRFCNMFLSKPMYHGGMYPWYKLSVYKNGKGFMEDRNMDEHIVVENGKVIRAKKDSLHYAYRGLTFFTNKCNWYSSKEAKDYIEHSSGKIETKSLKSILKMKVYYKMPLGLRAWIYYVYRYYFRLGFLDGKEGQIFAFLHAYWYRFLVDAKIYESSINGKKIDNLGPLK